MPDAPFSCPFCNAAIAPEAATTSGRITCPRCGDSFPVKVDIGFSKAAGNLDDEVQRHRQARQVKASRSIKTTVIVCLSLGVLGVLVGTGISYFHEKPAHLSPTGTDADQTTAPLDLPVLAYLPAGTDSVAALSLRSLIEDARHNSPGKNAHPVLTELGLPSELIDGLTQVVGIEWDNIEELVIGATLKSGEDIAKQPVLVLRTIQPFSIDELSKRRGARIDVNGHRTYYRFPISPKFRLFELRCWAPSDRLLVVSLSAACLDAIPDKGYASHENLSPRIVSGANDLLPRDSCCWAVLDSDRWDLLTKFFIGIGGKSDRFDEKLADQMAILQTAVIGFRLETEPIVTAWFDLKSESAANDLRLLLAERFKNEQGKIIVGGAGNRVMVRMAAKEVAAAIGLAMGERKGKK